MTTATGTFAPGPAEDPGPEASASDTEVISWADFRAWER